MDLWVKFPSSMHKIAGTLKEKIKTAMRTGQLRLQKPANRTSYFLLQIFSFKVPPSPWLRHPPENPKIKQKQHSQM